MNVWSMAAALKPVTLAEQFTIAYNVALVTEAMEVAGGRANTVMYRYDENWMPVFLLDAVQWDGSCGAFSRRWHIADKSTRLLFERLREAGLKEGHAWPAGRPYASRDS